jgi:hypothetical protein
LRRDEEQERTPARKEIEKKKLDCAFIRDKKFRLGAIIMVLAPCASIPRLWAGGTAVDLLVLHVGVLQPLWRKPNVLRAGG